MKTRFPFVCFRLASLSATVVLLTHITASAAPEKVLARTRAFDSNSGSNAIPVSVFSMPTNKVAGRDPFYPECDCGGRIVVQIPVTTTHEGPTLALVLQGLSGTV